MITEKSSYCRDCYGTMRRCKTLSRTCWTQQPINGRTQEVQEYDQRLENTNTKRWMTENKPQVREDAASNVLNDGEVGGR